MHIFYHCYLYPDNDTAKVYIMMEDRLSALFQKEEEYTILDK